MSFKKAILINDTSNENHIGSKTVIDNIINECKRNGIEVICGVNRNNLHLLKSLQEAELVIINGEGTFHHNTVFIKDLLDGLQLFKNVPKVLINTVWDNMTNEYADTLLNQMVLISARESHSYNQISQVYNRDDLYIIPDAIFLTDPKKYNIGYGDSVINDIRKEFSKKDNHFPLNSQIHIPDVYSYLNWLSTLDIYITGRFHGACLSAIANIPFLAIESNCHKISSLLDDMGCSKLLINSLNDINKQNIELSKMYKKKLKLYTNDAKIHNHKLFNMLGQI